MWKKSRGLNTFRMHCIWRHMQSGVEERRGDNVSKNLIKRIITGQLLSSNIPWLSQSYMASTFLPLSVGLPQWGYLRLSQFQKWERGASPKLVSLWGSRHSDSAVTVTPLLGLHKESQPTCKPYLHTLFPVYFDKGKSLFTPDMHMWIY